MSNRALLTTALLLALVIGCASVMPPELKQSLHTQGPLHPWLHLLSFAALAFLLLRTTRSLVLRVILAVALYLFGFATEARESHNDGWPIERRDVLTDTAGVVLGSLLTLATRRKLTPSS